MQDPLNQSDAGLGGEASEEMTRYGIKCAGISQFFYGNYSLYESE